MYRCACVDHSLMDRTGCEVAGGKGESDVQRSGSDAFKR